MSLTLALAAAAPLIVGDWAYVPALRDTRAPVDVCETDNGVRYLRNGRFATFDGDARGTWRMVGRRLVEQETHRRAAGERERRVWPKPTVMTLHWLSPNHLNATVAGEAQGLLRCRTAR